MDKKDLISYHRCIFNKKHQLIMNIEKNLKELDDFLFEEFLETTKDLTKSKNEDKQDLSQI